MTTPERGQGLSLLFGRTPGLGSAVMPSSITQPVVAQQPLGSDLYDEYARPCWPAGVTRYLLAGSADGWWASRTGRSQLRRLEESIRHHRPRRNPCLTTAALTQPTATSTAPRPRGTIAREGPSWWRSSALGGLALAVGAVDSSATADTQGANESPVTLAPPVKPPAGMVWLQGKLTDQAGHGLDNVNVEVWSDAGAIEPAASNLTYGGSPADGRHGHGAYRVEVPEGVPYTLVFSAVGGEEDGDAFRMQAYGQGRPIMTLGKVAAGRAPFATSAPRSSSTRARSGRR